MDKQPPNSNVIGYVESEGAYFGICRRQSIAWILILVALFMGLVAGVGHLGIKVFTQDYEVPKWIASQQTGDDVVGELDFGGQKVNNRFTYSGYVTYDGSNVLLFYDTKDTNLDVAVKVGDTVSDFVPITQGYSIPMQLDIKDEDAIDGILLVRKGEKIQEYPLVVEKLITIEETIPQGRPEEQEVAYNEYVESVAEERPTEGVPVETQPPKSSGNLRLKSTRTDDGADIDYDNFDVITYKTPEVEGTGE